MTRGKRLRRIEELRRQTEEQAASELASARQEIAGRRQVLAQLEAHRADYLTRGEPPENATCSIVTWRNKRQFLRHLDTVIDSQTIQYERDESMLAQLQDHWRSAHVARRAVEMLGDRVIDEERRAEDQREQRLQDDRAAFALRTHAGVCP